MELGSLTPCLHKRNGATSSSRRVGTKTDVFPGRPGETNERRQRRRGTEGGVARAPHQGPLGGELKMRGRSSGATARRVTSASRDDPKDPRREQPSRQPCRDELCEWPPVDSPVENYSGEGGGGGDHMLTHQIQTTLFADPVCGRTVRTYARMTRQNIPGTCCSAALACATL